jgi:chorismate-pyruvate lyase
MTLAVPHFPNCKTPAEAVASLLAPVPLRQVAPEAVPEPARTLLVHRGHMTEALEARHRAPLTLAVVEDRLGDGVYWRKILLHAREKLVEYGVVRIYLRYLPEAVADEILSRRTPLGRVLISHNVLRQVDPKWYVEIPTPELVAHFGVPPEAGAAAPPHLFGRVGIIHCNNEPAIELLEVVTE